MQSDGYSTEQTERAHRPSLQKRQKVALPKYYLFLHSSTMKVAPYLHLNFGTKVEMQHSIKVMTF